jgi:hypothetical protein
MSKWLKIREKLYQEKIKEVNSLFAEIKHKVHDIKAPRYEWVAPLENWTRSQIKENTSLKLSLSEYTYLKNIVENLNNNFALNHGGEDQILTKTQDAFINNYTKILASKDNELKLEITAQLIEEKQFPLEIFIEWYKAAHTLPEAQFNEELGNFWGDVWKHAATGAGYGVLAGLPGGLGGSFAGAGLGGLAGGLYGGTSNLLKRVWQYRQTQRNFEQTKQKAVDALKKLKELSQNFEMHPNFINSLDSMIDQLSSARAYRLAQTGTMPTNQNAVPGKTVNPMKQPHPGWAELGKHSATASSPTPTTVAPPVTPTSTVPTPEPTSVLPTKRTQNLTPEERQRRKDRMHQHWAKIRTDKEEKERQAALAAAGSPSVAGPAEPVSSEPTAVAPAEPAKEGIKDEKDFIDLYNKVKDDPKALAKIGLTLKSMGMDKHKIHKDGTKEIIVNPNKKFSADDFNQFFSSKMVSYEPEGEEFEESIKFANLYAQSLGAQSKPDESLGQPGTPKETPSKAGEEPVTKELKSDEEMMAMKIKDFKNYVKSLDLPHLLEDEYIQNFGKAGSPERSEAIKLIRLNIENPEYGKNESAFVRIGKMLKPRLHLETIPVSERVQYIKSLLRA